MLFITAAGLVLGVIADRRARPLRALGQVDDLRGSVRNSARGLLLELDLCDLRGKRMDFLPYLDVKTVSLGNARMDCASAHAIGRMKSLTKLTTIHAAIDDQGLDELAGLSELRELSVDYSQCTLAGIVRLNALPKLQQLSMQGLSGDELRLVDFPQLQIASLKQPELTNIYIERLPSLHQVNVTGGACAITLATLPQLASVNFELKTLGDARFEDLPALQSVALIVQMSPPALDRRQLCEQLAALPSLAQVELIGFGLTDDDCAAIATSPVLRTVIIGDSGAALSGEAVGHLLANKTLQAIDFSLAEISDEARALVGQLADDRLIQVNLPDETVGALLREGYSRAMIRRMGSGQRTATIKALEERRKALTRAAR
jgi:hypothetical protein